MNRDLSIVLLSIFFASICHAQQFVQIVPLGGCNGTGTAACSASPNQFTVGDTSFVIVACIGSSSCTPSVTGTQGKTYTAIASCSDATDSMKQVLFEADNMAFANETVTIVGGGGIQWEAAHMEYSGLATPAFDQTACGHGTAASATSGNTPTTTAANELVLGFGTGPRAFTVGAGYTQRENASSNFFEIVEDKTVSSTGAYAATATNDGSHPWVMMAVTLKTNIVLQTPMYVFAGDSITALSNECSVNTDAKTWPAQAMALSYFTANPHSTREMDAVDGWQTTDILNGYTVNVHPYRPNGSNITSGVVFVMIGINDFFHHSSVSTFMTNVRSIWSQARADGFKVAAFTIMPASGLVTGADETNRVAANVAIKADGANYDYLIDVDSDQANILASSCDNVHPGVAGETILAAFVNSSLPAQPNACGIKDTSIHVPTSYTTLAPPAYGFSYTDPLTGCVIRRLVNGTHEYSEMSPINVDDTKIIVGITGTNGRTIIDMNGNTICGPVTEIGGNSEPRWDKTDNNKVWFHPVGSNQIKTLNATTCATTVYDTLAAYAGSGLWFCGGESDISADGDHFCVSDPSSTASTIRRYTISTKTLGTAISGGSSGTASVDFGDITPVNNNIFINYGSPRSWEIYNGSTGAFIRQVANWSSHSDRFVGPASQEEFFTGNGNNPLPGSCSGTAFVTFDMSTSGNHPACTGIDTGQYLSSHVSCNNEYGSFPPTRQTCMLSIDADSTTWPAITAVSVTGGHAGSGYAVNDTFSIAGGTKLAVGTVTGVSSGAVTTFTFSGGTGYTATANNVATTKLTGGGDNALQVNITGVTNWTPSWNAFNNEIIVQNTDGSGLVRIAQHRSIDTGSYYWNQTRAALSRSGKWVVYDSNFGRGTGVDDAFIDVWLVQVPDASVNNVPPIPPAPPAGMFAQIRDCGSE